MRPGLKPVETADCVNKLDKIVEGGIEKDGGFGRVVYLPIYLEIYNGWGRVDLNMYWLFKSLSFLIYC